VPVSDRNAKAVCLGSRVFKRSVDIVLAALLLAVVFPFIVLAAIVIKLGSEGPVIFRQVRMGRGFRSFELLKLRTMVSSVDGPTYTFGADPRITRTGMWLRRHKFDELPQLWNVLRGDMSLVGPRPVIPELTQEFKQDYALLLAVRPGLTDPATLKYCHESEVLALVPDPLRYFKTVVTPDKLRISRAYLQRANAFSDLGVMAGTVLALLAFLVQSWLGQSAVMQPGKAHVSISPEAVRRRKAQPMMESALIAGPVELMAAVEGDSGRFGYLATNRLAYRHFRQEPMPRAWDRERFRL
jgi:lipopolysaccharide/colanic/teichoic acid biosynthesis glycosyltransferase